MIKDKVLMIMKNAGVRQVDLAKISGRTIQSVNNKFAKDSFFAKDIISICELCSCKLQAVDKNGKIVASFDVSDLNEGSKNG